MNYLTFNQVVSFMEDTYWVNAKGSGLYTQPLSRMLGQIKAMLSHHNKVLLLRFDLHQPEFSDTSKHVSKFFKQLIDKLTKQYKLKRIGFAWAREQEKVDQQHYHCFILLDGNKVRVPHNIIKAAQWYWGTLYDGHLSWPSERCYYLINRGDKEKLQEAIYHISYLAKGRGKDRKPEQSKSFGISRVQEKE